MVVVKFRDLKLNLDSFSLVLLDSLRVFEVANLLRVVAGFTHFTNTPCERSCLNIADHLEFNLTDRLRAG